MHVPIHTASIGDAPPLGLTATLVREDGREDDVFALIGPKKADAPPKTQKSRKA
jgi:DNA excision repair protein ERCC-3